MEKGIENYNYFRKVKRNAVKVLTEKGMNVREALTLLREYSPYLFDSKNRCIEMEECFKRCFGHNMKNFAN